MSYFKKFFTSAAVIAKHFKLTYLSLSRADIWDFYKAWKYFHFKKTQLSSVFEYSVQMREIPGMLVYDSCKWKHIIKDSLVEKQRHFRVFCKGKRKTRSTTFIKRSCLNLSLLREQTPTLFNTINIPFYIQVLRK